jgi:hypothetical protein
MPVIMIVKFNKTPRVTILWTLISLTKLIAIPEEKHPLCIKYSITMKIKNIATFAIWTTMILKTVISIF